MLIIKEADTMSDCSSCKSKDGCSGDKSTCMLEFNTTSKVKKIIGVMSGKGGVGKSTISASLAKELKRQGHKVGVLDGDITGPSIPRLLGIKNKRALATEQYIMPAENEDGIKVMSLNLLIDDESQPVIWRGPVIGETVKKFWTDVYWDELDYLIIDMPPGTGDVALTVMQSIPLDGVVVVSVPQDMVSMIVAKSVNMARRMNMNVLGVVENMSYIECEDCGKNIRLFDSENTKHFLKNIDLDLLGELPMKKEICDISKEPGKEDETARRLFEPIASKIKTLLKED